MKQSKTTELMVGMLIAAGLAALFVLAMKVSNLSSYSAKSSYTVIARFENVGGLKVRSPVMAGGVLVGRVAGIDYDSDRYEAVVTMEMDQSYDRFPDDTVASIYTAGLLGEQYVALDPGGSEDFLVDGSEIEFTASALVLEKLVGKFLLNSAESGNQ
ncbi:MAG TPA: outer membrane lipid asymmetry maintenance protein MlaD [Gammaproteobacteria bacterium]|nr:outer membrane lipid asymmetry maintenance protein MlaD [Gammaproteobacteria bacterium]